jgi:Fe-S-cluster-containing dehydrogenase component
MTRYAMAVDLSRCVGCSACMVACKAENQVPAGAFRLRVGEMTWGEPQAIASGRWGLPESANGAAGIHVETLHAQCYHCEGAPCTAVCPTGATYQDKATGIVKIDPARCTGCKACIVACPYGMRHLDPLLGVADKCSFCDHRLARGLHPACVDVCPTGARLFGDLDTPSSPLMQALGSAARVEVERPDIGVRPKLFFLNGAENPHVQRGRPGQPELRALARGQVGAAGTAGATGTAAQPASVKEGVA